MTNDELAVKISTGTLNEIMASNARMLRNLADAFDRGVNPERPVAAQITGLVDKTTNLIPALGLGNLTGLAIEADRILGHLRPLTDDE